jgi:GNAT superfamily N-acetyltransferase
MARDFHAASPMGHLPFAPEAAGAAAMLAVDSDDRVALVLDIDGLHGALIGSVRRYPLGPTITAYEDVFWIDPEHRGKWAIKLIAAFEAWAISRGAAIIGLSCPVGTVENLYSRMGYNQSETTFAKAV